MAEAFFRKYSPKKFHAVSAGTNPSSKINQTVVQAMKEIGINIENKIPTHISNEALKESTITVNMGCIDKESCPALFLKDVQDWGISDPKGKSIYEVRKIRDEIEIKIKDLIKNLEK